MKKLVLPLTVTIALCVAGAATAYALNTITLTSGHCVTVAQTRVCAAKTRARTITMPSLTVTSTELVTVTVDPPPPPPPTTLNWSGAGEQNLGPFVLAKPSTIVWTATFMAGFFVSGPKDTYHLSGNSGSSYLPAGSYAGIQVFGQGWTITITTN